MLSLCIVGHLAATSVWKNTVGPQFPSLLESDNLKVKVSEAVALIWMGWSAPTQQTLQSVAPGRVGKVFLSLHVIHSHSTPKNRQDLKQRGPRCILGCGNGAGGAQCVERMMALYYCRVFRRALMTSSGSSTAAFHSFLLCSFVKKKKCFL